MKTMRYYWRKTALYLGVFLTIIMVGAVIFSTYRSMLSLIVYGAIVLISLFVLVNWHARTFAYRCADCGHIFEISMWKDLISPHGIDKKGGWKYLHCPECSRWMKARLLPKEPVQET